MGQNCEKFIPICLESVKEADVIVYCDGGSTDNTLKYLINDELFTAASYKEKSIPPHIERWIIQNKYNQEDKAMNGKQRNFYLNYLKENYPNDWCLVLDADEVLDDNGIAKIKEFINQPHLHNEEHCGVFSVQMEHFIGNLGQVDATQETHFVPNRLFKINEVDNYPEVEHPVLVAKNNLYGKCADTTIFHMAYIPNMWEIRKRYENHMKKSNMHTPEYLKSWYYSHLFGLYPTRKYQTSKVPSYILKSFGIDPDEIYFANRGLETKHFIDAKHWKDFFEPTNAIEVGCGLGPRVGAMRTLGLDAKGIELSKWAVENSLCKGYVNQGDIVVYEEAKKYDLVVCYDILEHICYNDIDKAIDNIIKLTKKNILVSVPYKGTPNCDNDSTHKIKESREWWLSIFMKRGLIPVDVPKNFLYSEQLLIFKK
jgi:glycosyltransferase involved in cell wall biosynthesis